MDNIVSTPKTLSMTPFSINDILTKNNTTLFRKNNSVESSSVICTSPTNSEFDETYLNHRITTATEHHHIDSNNCATDSHGKTIRYRFGSSSPRFYNNNNNHCVSNYNSESRRKSLDCFLMESGDLSKEQLSDCERYNGENLNTSDRKPRYCSFGSGEIPLDMRRCTSNDSGMKFNVRIIMIIF